jgi:dihydrofolate reductase
MGQYSPWARQYSSDLGEFSLALIPKPTTGITFTLVAVVSADGLIARFPGHRPQEWASTEEQNLFLERVDQADWSFLGRTTHECAFRPDRRRVIFSSGTHPPSWRHSSHLWLDPNRVEMHEILDRLSAYHAPQDCLILGGQRVHDWFLVRGMIDCIELTIEPLRLHTGIPLFSHLAAGDPVASLIKNGYTVIHADRLNAQGTHRLRLVPRSGVEANDHDPSLEQ